MGQEAIEHIEGFAGATGDDPCSKDAELVRHVSVKAHCTVIVGSCTRNGKYSVNGILSDIPSSGIFRVVGGDLATCLRFIDKSSEY